MTTDLENLIFNDIPDPDDRPLPDLIIDHLGGAIQFIDRDDGTRLYRLVDWVYEITGSTNKQRHLPWVKLKAKLSASYSSRDVPKWNTLTIETSGGTQTADFTTADGLYAITQRMSDRSKTVRLVKDYLAKAGVLVDDLRRDPARAYEIAAEPYRQMGKSEDWIEARLKGKISRKRFMTALRNAVSEMLQDWHYATATNDMYLGLWNRTAAQLREEMDLPAKASLRDNQSHIALLYLTLAEATATEALAGREEITWDYAREIVKEIAAMIGAQARQTGQKLGIDIATGRKLVNPPDPNSC